MLRAQERGALRGFGVCAGTSIHAELRVGRRVNVHNARPRVCWRRTIGLLCARDWGRVGWGSISVGGSGSAAGLWTRLLALTGSTQSRLTDGDLQGPQARKLALQLLLTLLQAVRDAGAKDQSAKEAASNDESDRDAAVHVKDDEARYQPDERKAAPAITGVRCHCVRMRAERGSKVRGRKNKRSHRKRTPRIGCFPG
jgi:hypothetical protein